MSEQPSEQGKLKRLWQSYPHTIVIGVALLVNACLIVLVEVLRALFSLNDVHAMVFVMFAWAAIFMSCGFVFKNIHGGFAVLMEFIALIGAIGLWAMYAARPELFGAIVN
jgi:hypothetical protein